TILTATGLRLTPGTQLSDVVNAIRPLLDEFTGLDLGTVPRLGEISNPDTNECLMLSASSQLTFVLNCQSKGHGHLPNEAIEALAKLEALLAGPGAVTVYNEDVTPYTEGAVSYRFLGANDRMRAIARLNCGFAALREVLGPTLTPEQLENLRHQAMQMLSGNEH
ncbi:MAG: hypothetical protein O9327_05835, partial [Polaromonas sp.]|nr:hypothetical protein [Polaromonas sp.]